MPPCMCRCSLAPCCSAVHYAAANGHYDVVDFLLGHLDPSEYNAENDEGGGCGHGKPGASWWPRQVQRISWPGRPCLSADRVCCAMIVGVATPFFRAAEEDHAEILRLLMDEGAKTTIASQGLLPVHAAARRGHVQATQFLLAINAAHLTATTAEGENVL